MKKMTPNARRHLLAAPKKTQKSMVLRRLRYAMDRALAESRTHKDPKWQARLLECHFIYVDAYIEVKEHMP